MISEAREYLNPKDVQVVVYHKNCQDGMAAAMCAWRLLGEIKYIPMQYNDKISDHHYFDKNVLLVDFSWDVKTLQSVRKIAKKVMILDHHRSAIEKLDEIEGCFFDISESGASLAWMYFFNNNVPMFIEYIKDRDIWKWEFREKSEPLYYGIFDRWHRSFRDYEKYVDDENLLNNLIEHGKNVMKDNQDLIENNIAPHAQESIMFVKNRKYRIMQIKLKTRKLTSEIAEYIYTHNDVDFVVCWSKHRANTIPEYFEKFAGYFPFNWIWPNQRYILSFRTNKDHIDVSKIAQSLGGGGHIKAAATQINYHPLLILK